MHTVYNVPPGRSILLVTMLLVATVVVLAVTVGRSPVELTGVLGYEVVDRALHGFSLLS